MNNRSWSRVHLWLKSFYCHSIFHSGQSKLKAYNYSWGSDWTLMASWDLIIHRGTWKYQLLSRWSFRRCYLFKSISHCQEMLIGNWVYEGIQFASIIIGIPLCLKMINVLLKVKVSYMELGHIRQEIQEVESRGGRHSMAEL